MTLRAIAGGGGGATLKTNGTTNSTQTLLNLTQGGGVTLTEAAGVVTIASTNADATLLFADAPNQDFDLTNGGAGGAVTILTKSITGIVSEDQILLDLWFSILNNSTAARTYTPTVSLGSVSMGAADQSTLQNSATARATRRMTYDFSVSANNLMYAQMTQLGSGAQPDGANASLVFTVTMWHTSTNDVTGTQTISFTMASSSTTATQTLTLHSYTVRKISKI